MKGLLEEFKTFIMKGNVIDLSVGVIIGAAFGTIVKAFTDGIVQPLLAAAGGSPEVGLKLWVFDMGLVISALINFLIIAAIVFFVFVKPMNILAARLKKGEEPAAPEPSDEVKLLTEIRDLLKKP